MAVYLKQGDKYIKKDIVYSNTGPGEETTIEVKFYKLPNEVKKAFKNGETQYGNLPKPPNSKGLTAKSCVFCESFTKLTRYVNGQVVYICEEHYQNKNIGQIAQRLTEIKDEEKED